jgi:hypothetical protein
VHAWDAPEVGLAGLRAYEPDTTERHIIQMEPPRHPVGMDRLTHQLRKRIGSEACDDLPPGCHHRQHVRCGTLSTAVFGAGAEAAGVPLDGHPEVILAPGLVNRAKRQGRFALRVSVASLVGEEAEEGGQ